jgi:hypothetical protein
LGRSGRSRSCGRGGQHEGEIIAQGRDGFQGHVTGALHGPFVVLLEQDRADQAGGLISPLRRSKGLVEWILARCSFGKVM